MVRRFAMLAVSLSLWLAWSGSPFLRAQDTSKSVTAKDDEAKKDETKKDETKKDEANKDEATKDEAPKPIPPEVEAKLEAARKAVAEAIVAAQDAGLVQTTIDPPPILDILITGRATDEAGLKAKTGVSPEVFGAWYTGYGKDEFKSTYKPETDVRIINPSAGLKTWYDQRAAILNREIEAVRKAKGTPAKPQDEAKTDEAKKDEAKKEAPKADEPKKDEVKKDEPKKDEVKKDEPKADEPKKDDTQNDEAEKDESKKDDAQKDEAKSTEPKKDESK